MNLSSKEHDSDELAHKEAAEALNPDLLKTGLSSAVAQEKLRQHGFNEVPEKKSSPILQFVKKFWGLSAWMLEIIIALSLVFAKICRRLHCSGSACAKRCSGFFGGTKGIRSS